MRFSSPSRFPLTILLLAVCSPSSAMEQNKPGGDLDKKPVVKVTIGKETTYITEPLRPDGYPDYLAAINQRMSQGVTPENNAVVLLAKAIGPSVVDEKLRPEFFKLLDIEPLPEKGDYFVSQEEMIERWQQGQPDSAPMRSREELQQQFYDAYERPWSEDEFPIVAEWLRINEKPLQLIREATRRPRFYCPWVNDSNLPRLFSAPLPYSAPIRDATNLLVSHAMYQLHRGEIEKAWQDLLACHRFARLAGQSVCLIEALVSYAVEGIALSGDAVLAHHGRLSAEQAARIQAELLALPRVASIINFIDQGERWVFLDIITSFAKDGKSSTAFDLIGMIPSLSLKENVTKKLMRALILERMLNWDIPLKIGNEWFDRVTNIVKIENPREMRTAFVEFEADLEKLEPLVTDPWILTADLFTKKNLSAVLSPRVGRALVCLMFPAIRASAMAHERTQLFGQMTHVAFALAAFRADHGHYPDELDELTPKYIAKIPDDIFAPQPTPIRYRREGEAYVLWSVYLNGIDDGGPNEDNAKSEESDDFGLRPERPKGALDK